ncbi:MAG TPA: hypothetical protein VMU14_19745 [Acidimicrobiales bacterium]|nr:hypothetical protein [Acidimicrobiales bacterium]
MMYGPRPRQAALLRRVAVGDLDALSGQHLSVHDDLEGRVRHATEAAS